MGRRGTDDEDPTAANIRVVSEPSATRNVRGAHARPRVTGTYFEPGTVIEGYRIIDRLGEGGMGVVYAAFDPKLERRVAIKVLRSNGGDMFGEADAEDTQRMLREAQAMAKLSHPNVAAIYQVGQVAGSIFIVMEFIAGGTLKQWLKAKARSWREIVEVLVAAGRGLQAAHRAGIIHRDFKPDNILIGKDGRVRVTDFGLARAAQRTSEQSMSIVQHVDHNDASITGTGSVMGTPAYMAPELFRTTDDGGPTPPADARADQFAFCVTSFEALCGTRPFAGETPHEVVLNICEGRLLPFPSHVKIRRRVRSIVNRGLSHAPEQRFASMGALLAKLDRRPTSRRRIAMFAVAAIALAVGSAFVARQYRASAAAQCADSRLAETWNPDVKTAIARAFDASKLPYAATARDSVIATVDQYSTAWDAMHRDSCEATHVRGEQSEQLLDRRNLCLDRRRSELAAFVDVLQKGTPEVIQSSVVASHKLSPIEQCSAEIQAHADSPTPEKRAIANLLGTQLARAKVLLNSGSFDESLQLATTAITQARTAELQRLLAEALLIAGQDQHQKAKLDEAEELLIQVVAPAKASNAPEIEEEAYIELIWLEGWGQGRPTIANVWDRLALAGVKAGIGGPAMEARLYNRRSGPLYKEGKLAEALESAERARGIQEKLYPQGDPELAESLNIAGSVSLTLGHPEQAIVDHKAAVAMFEKLLGADHPQTADALNNLANDYASSDPDEAERLYRRAMDIYIRSLGPSHTGVAVSLSNLAALAVARKDYRRAITYLEHALDIETAAHGASHPIVAETLANIGSAELANHQPARAVDVIDRALKIWAAEDKVPPAGEAARFTLAKAAWQLGERARAKALATAARERLAAAGSEWTGTVDEIDAWLSANH